MLGNSIAAGITAIKTRPGLIGLIYGINLALALLLAVPIYVMLGNTVNTSGFAAELAETFDVVLWADILIEAGPMLATLFAQLFWVIPIYLVWKVAVGVGLVQGLRDGGVRSFWQGVGEYTGRGLLLAVLYLVVVAGWFVVLGILGFILSMAWTGEIGTFWSFFVIIPTLVIAGIAMVDLMHDYARIGLVVDHRPVMEAWLSGLAWPFKHGASNALYLVWFIPAAVLIVLPTLLEMEMGAVWGLFLLQQVLLATRAAVTVGWFGSEVNLYEQVRARELPLIALEEVEVTAPHAPLDHEETSAAEDFPGTTPDDGLAMA